MARKYPVEHWIDGDHIAPHEMNNEFRNVIGETAGMLDRDNLGAVLTADKFSLDSFSRPHIVASSGLDVFTKLNGRGGSDWLALDSMVLDLTTPDCWLMIEGRARWSFVSTNGGITSTNIRLGIRVDGEIYADDDGNHPGILSEDSAAVMAAVPVSAGTNKIELVIQAPRFLAITVNVTDRQLMVREVRR